MNDTAILHDALVPKWRPTIPVDIAAIVDRVRYYTNGRWRFVVFSHGTIALVPNDGNDAASDAQDLLREAGFGHADFNPILMDDGNRLVGFTQHVCGVVLEAEMVEHRDYIEMHFRSGVRAKEALVSGEASSVATEDPLKAGLLARARLFMDAESLIVVSICEPGVEAG
jgi:hypothetical protein